MKTVYFAFPQNEELTKKLVQQDSESESGNFEIRHFPDGEIYLRIVSDINLKNIVLVCSLNQPNEKILQLYLFAKTAKSLGALKITLLSPYLAYMRQDSVFKPGEGITSTFVAGFFSSFIDELITIDPHLHRIQNLSEIYSISTKVLHAAELIADWIKKSVPNALIIGPDSESEQWVSNVATKAGVAYTVLEKVRSGDKEVKISIPQVDKYKHHLPVLVDDIVSTGRTLIETIKHLKEQNMANPVCVVIHPVFSEGAFELIIQAGASKIISCNTIQHLSNGIDISPLFVSK